MKKLWSLTLYSCIMDCARSDEQIENCTMLEISKEDCLFKFTAEGIYPAGHFMENRRKRLIFLWLLAVFIGGGWGPETFGGGIEAGQLSGIEAAVREEMEKGNIRL